MSDLFIEEWTPGWVTNPYAGDAKGPPLDLDKAYIVKSYDEDGPFVCEDDEPEPDVEGELLDDPADDPAEDDDDDEPTQPSWYPCYYCSKPAHKHNDIPVCIACLKRYCK